MTKINLDYYNAKDNYSDGDIEDEILNLVQSGDWEEKIYKKNMGYPVLYHLSHIRENILSWYPFSQQDSILEIGSGCGAITGVLCKKAKNVVSIELSKRRAQINYERHKDFDNLEIIVGNLNDIVLNKRFDYVILNGVLEYAMSFTKGNSPFETFLKNLKKYLNRSGKIIIAIENRLGLKYFSGAAEDHTKNYFLGLNSYKNNNQVRTFSKSELKLLLEDCGFLYQKFYYPYPDYKFPYEIFTDYSMETYQYGRKCANLDEDRYSLFDQELVAASLRNEGVASIFANSFLVIAGEERGKIEPEIEYVKLSNDRKKEYQIGTLIQAIDTKKEGNKKEVIKFALNDFARSHIRQIQQNEQMGYKDKKGAISYMNLKGDLLEDKLKYDYIYENSLDYLIESFILQKAPESIKDELKKFFSIYFQDFNKKMGYHTKTFAKVFGEEKWEEETECILPANIDLILNNIFISKDSYIIIDCEWIFEFDIPCKFIIWRSINELYTTKGKRLERLLTRWDLMKQFQIFEKDEMVFRKWADHFTDLYLGCNQLKEYQQPVKEISLDSMYSEEKKHRILYSSLYIDLGDGFDEESKLYTEVPILEDHFSVKYHIESLEGLKELRWDPLEGKFCKCIIEEIKGIDDIVPINATYVKGRESVFYTKDPIYSLTIPIVPSKEIEINGIIKFIEADKIISDLLEQNEKYKDEMIFLDEISHKIEKMQEEIIKVTEEKDNNINRLETKFGNLERRIYGRRRKKRR